MKTSVIDSLEGLERLRPEWAELWLRCPRATPFQSPQWLIPWTKYLFGGGDIQVLEMREERELIGLAPLFRWGTTKSTISFLGAGISDYGDLLFAPGRERDCASEVWKFLETQRESTLDLQELRAGSALLEGHPAQPCSVCPVLDLSTWPNTMDHKHRTDLRRAQNKLTKHSGLHLTMAAPHDLPQHLNDFFQLYETRWGAMEASIRCFHLNVTAEFAAAGLLRLSVLRIDAVPAAAIYAFVTGQTLYCYLSGFNPELAKLSPGAVLLGWLIDEAIKEGIQYVDFLRETEPYKYLWGARDRLSYKIGQRAE